MNWEVFCLVVGSSVVVVGLSALGAGAIVWLGDRFGDEMTFVIGIVIMILFTGAFVGLVAE